MAIKGIEKRTPIGRRIVVSCLECGKQLGNLSHWSARYSDSQSMLEYLDAHHHCTTRNPGVAS